jgi:hypothetical protein
MLTEMHPEIKELWVEALNSGGYDQTQMSLRYKEGFCCLGVLCDLYLKHSGDSRSKWYQGCGGEFCFVIQEQDKEDSFLVREQEFLPDCVRQWAGIKVGNPVIEAGVYKDMVALSKLNDDGYDFATIASFIKEQL